MDLASVRARILGASAFEGALPGFAGDISRLCGAERITIYRVERQGSETNLVSALQVGLGNFRALKLPMRAAVSMASYSAVTRKPLNVADAYDERERACFEPPVSFLRKVDERTGFRTRQVLVVPFPRDPGQPLLGVLQLLNRTEPGPFPDSAKDAALAIGDALAELILKVEAPAAGTPPPPMLQALITQAQHHDPEQRRRAAEALRGFPGAAAESALLQLVRDGYLEIAGAAARSLAALGSLRAADAILARMPEGEAAARQAAEELRAFPEALQELARQDERVRPHAQAAEQRLASAERSRRDLDARRKQERSARQEARDRAEGPRQARIDGLRELAREALDEHAPLEAARAREELLLLYRERYEATGKLHWSAGGGDPWDLDDSAALRWVCALAQSGHVGADRLLARILARVRGSDLPPEVWDELGASSRRVGWHLCLREFDRRPIDREALLRRLECCGEQCAALARAARNLCGPASDPLELGSTLRSNAEIAIGSPSRGQVVEECGQPAQFVAELGMLRLGAARAAKRDALRLLEEASAQGSAQAAQALWFDRYAPFRSDGAALAGWLETRPDPSSVGSEERFATAVALERGSKYLPASFPEALRWYRAAFGAPEPTGSTPDPVLCLRIGDRLRDMQSKELEELAHAWYRQGMEGGNLECLEKWLRPMARGARDATDADADLALKCAARVTEGTGMKVAVHAFAIVRKFFSTQPGANDSIAAKWAALGARFEHPYCRWMLFTLLVSGRGLARDLPAARRQLDALLEGDGPPLAKMRLQLAEAYDSEGDAEAARPLLEEAARGSDAQVSARARALLQEAAPG